ncbi:hypothetical protein ABIE44_002120 [Marmoricola sp. OAE513]|uniref:class F sortase n=1 Tax=Marmoricola sp. OAE513 TaxID=2817894 RepID=UPI001AE86BC0
MTTTTVSNQRRAALVVLVVATTIALVWTFWPQGERKSPAAKPPPAQAVLPGTVLKSSECGNQADKPFRPTRITVSGVGKNSQVLALGRDGNNVPRAPSLSSAGKTQYGWDDPAQATNFSDTLKPAGALPGSAKGNVLLNAHTWPDGSALGNRLMEHLKVGDKIVLGGKHAELCYRVTKKIVIKAADGSAEYYQQDGPPQLALIVCSPPRIGPGNWVHRTIWFASPMAA